MGQCKKISTLEGAMQFIYASQKGPMRLIHSLKACEEKNMGAILLQHRYQPRGSDGQIFARSCRRLRSENSGEADNDCMLNTTLC